MDQELFNPQSPSVTSSRILYTPSTFARTSLLHLQEVGLLQAIHQHTSTRTNLTSFLCFVVLSGTGSLTYEGTTYELSAGDCVFIDCRKAYSHSTSEDLWSLQWCHFYAPSLPAVYEKYKAPPAYRRRLEIMVRCMRSTKSVVAGQCSIRRILNPSLHF